jgi:hypothetical protein
MWRAGDCRDTITLGGYTLMNRSLHKIPVLSGRSVVWLAMVFAIAFVLSLKYSGSYISTTVDEQLQVVNLVSDPACDPVRQSCNALGGDVGVALQLGPGVRPLERFPVNVRLSGIAPQDVDSVRVNFVMRHMDMGRNLYQLATDNAGAWTGSATLPICSSNRLDWVAVVEVTSQATQYTAEYPFIAQ